MSAPKTLTAKAKLDRSSSDLRELLPPRVAYVFDDNIHGLKPILPKLLPLRSMSLVKLEKMQHDIEAVMKAASKNPAVPIVPS